MVQHYNRVDKWQEVSIPPYDSFWMILNDTALDIPVVKHNLTWCKDWRPLVKLLLKLYERFHEMTKEEPIKDLNNQLHDQNIRAYFKWVTETQESLRKKAAGFADEEWSEEDASQFDLMREAVVDISNRLHIDMGRFDASNIMKEANKCRRKAVEILFRCSHGER